MVKHSFEIGTSGDYTMETADLHLNKIFEDSVRYNRRECHSWNIGKMCLPKVHVVRALYPAWQC